LCCYRRCRGFATTPICRHAHSARGTFLLDSAAASWAYAFALQSAAAQAAWTSGAAPTDELEEGAVLTALRGTPGLRLERVDARACLAEGRGEAWPVDALVAIYQNW